MSPFAIRIRNIWEKNWPEVRAALSGGMPRFIKGADPDDLGTSVPAFCFHVIDPDRFEEDLRFLENSGYTTIDADTLLRHMTGESPAPERSVAITIDDGARNLHEVAWPLLRKHKMKAIAFVATAFHLDEVVREGCPLSWALIREMHESDTIDFQAHTHEHRYIPRWPEPLDLEGSDGPTVRALRGEGMSIEDDLRTAKEILEGKLGKTVNHLAFPKFDGTDRAIEVAEECGYKAFWWGVLPRIPMNVPGGSIRRIVRIDGRYVRRLPGMNRKPLSRILAERYKGSGGRLAKGLQAGGAGRGEAIR